MKSKRWVVRNADSINYSHVLKEVRDYIMRPYTLKEKLDVSDRLDAVVKIGKLRKAALPNIYVIAKKGKQ